MSNDSNSIAEAIRILKQAQSGQGVDMGKGLNPGLRGLSQSGAKAIDPKTIAFEAQMQMAQQAMGIDSLKTDGQQPDSTAMNFDMNIINDSMMMDALSTIARLTGQRMPGLMAPAAPMPLENVLTRNPEVKGLGSIAALFESGDKGVAAIGYDRTGGTSYGKFQISSRAGTMSRFLNFLSEQDPAMAERLRKAGPANTGSTKGGMPAEWAKIAAESPERFERLQTEFIKKDHYQPAREKIREMTGVDIEASKPALREALFSTAVQHGASGAARIFNEAIDKFLKKPEAAQAVAAEGKSFEQALVSEVYNKRQNQFGGSTEAVRQSVRGRLKQEKDMVLAMLDKKGMNRIV
ncbi:MAG: hypothetical protein RDU24_01880 [Humidesulfovibrio sp.]|uniref:VgrG-related protein n=1 Tax=Humidesulfovibrio sp. TaxID=2910988 RepID=UPI0027FE9F25|nr:hypothetical protein [Humidesulfovibrio sp.]MDQ7834106.1 hypothetical protein [Humidesulfovibrio sp.]